MADLSGGCLETPAASTQCRAWGEGRWIGRESPSLPLHVCFTKGAINSCSWFLSFLGTPHPTPGIRHFFRKHCSKSFCFIHIPSQWALIEHRLRVRNRALQQMPYLCVGPGEGRTESFVKANNACWADCLQDTVWLNFCQCDLVLVISVLLCLTKPGLQLPLLITFVYFMALVSCLQGAIR